MKARIGCLFIGMLAFCFILFWNAGIAEAGLLGLPILQEDTDDNNQQDDSGRADLLTGIADLTEKVAGHLDTVAETAGSMLEQTVETAVEAPLNLGSGAAELLAVDEELLSVDGLAAVLEAASNTVNTAILAPVANTAGTVLDGTTDIAAQIGVAVEEIVSAAVRTLPAPSTAPEETTACDMNPCPEPESPQPSDNPLMPPEPIPTARRVPLQVDMPASKPGPDHSSGDDQTNSRTAPGEAELEPKAESEEAEIVPVGVSQLVETPAAGMKQDKEPVADDDGDDAHRLAVPAEPEQAPPDHSTTSGERSSSRTGTLPRYVPVAPTNTATPQPASKFGGCFHLKLADGILTEMASMRMSGRRIYARNTKLVISKRGNEPPTPPPKHAFFSYADDLMGKGSVALGESNRSITLCDAESGRAIWIPRPPRN